MVLILRPCTTKSGYEALPADQSGRWRQEIRLEMSEVADILQSDGCNVLEVGVLTVIQCHDMAEVTVYPSGRLIIKTDDEAIARKAAEWVFNSLGLE
jgi:hypothetical protein